MRILYILLCLSINTICFSQQTVGLFTNSPSAFNGYTLFSPMISNFTYLIDNCGYEVHQWQSPFRPGLAVYLMDNGDLLRTNRVGPTPFAGGGLGGRLERRDWNNNLVWSYNIADSTQHQHHDVEILPNGNILVLAWESITRAEAIANGKNPVISFNLIWPDKIIELQPLGTDSAAIVWQWRYWDHLIQDLDSTKANFGVIADHPELIDVNLSPLGQPTTSDWNHSNGIDYNPVLDQILISSRNQSEIYIIDHSTTTAEAASHSGGNSGKGGDFLYRWGNPENYDRGTSADKQLFAQHNATWIPDGYDDGGKILVFNNGVNRQPTNYSSVDIINPPVDASGNYTVGITQAFAPAAPDWTFFDQGFFSVNVSGAQALPNGNVLICEGFKGNIFEVDKTGTRHWRYISPVTSTGPVTQGIPNATGNNLFRAERYGPDFPGFVGKTLTPIAPIELNPFPDTCTIYNDSIMTTITIIEESLEIKIFPNPIDDYLIIEANLPNGCIATIVDLNGRAIIQRKLNNTQNRLSFEDCPSGMYFIEIMDSNHKRLAIKKLLKR